MTKHLTEVVDPLLGQLRSKVKLVSYSLPLKEDPIRQKIYRSIRTRATAESRAEGEKELAEKLRSFDYSGTALPTEFELSGKAESIDYFRSIPGLDAYNGYNRPVIGIFRRLSIGRFMSALMMSSSTMPRDTSW